VNKRKRVNGPTPFTVQPSPVLDRPKMPPIGLAHPSNPLHCARLGVIPTAPPSVLTAPAAVAPRATCPPPPRPPRALISTRPIFFPVEVVAQLSTFTPTLSSASARSVSAQRRPPTPPAISDSTPRLRPRFNLHELHTGPAHLSDHSTDFLDVCLSHSR
jgi:hypothetical protein